MNKTTKKVLYGVAIFTGMAVAGVKIASTMQKKQCRNDEKNPFEGKRVIFVKNEEDLENADGVRGHLELVGNSKYTPSVYDKYVKDTNDTTPTVIASTASPYKFTRSVMEALGADTDGKDDFALADELSALSGVKLPQAVETIRTAPVLHNRVVDAPDMPKAVKDILGIR